MNDLHQHLVRWTDLYPDKTLIVEAETGRKLSYGRCLAVVQALRQMLGRRALNIVGLVPGGIPDALLWLAALTGGHLLFPLAPDSAAEERDRAVSMFKPDVLILESREQAEGFPGSKNARVVTWEQLNALIDDTTSSSRTVMDPVLGSVCLLTSGTTGTPKGVVLDSEKIAWTADHVRTSHRLTSDDIGITPLPFFHVNGPVVSLCASVLAGGTVVLARKFSRHHFWSWIENYQVTWASIVPTIVAYLLETERPTFFPGTLRFVRTGSDAVPPSDMLEFEGKFGVPVVETYGLTEAASQIVANPVPPGKRKSGSAGVPVGVELRVCRPRVRGDLELHDVPRGEAGEICVTGPSVISAYYGDAGSSSFRDGWFRTGDLGYQDEEGYVFLHGRLRDVIIRGGENIAPREVEEVLEGHPSVREAGVIGRADRMLGEQVIAYVVPTDGWNSEVERSVHDHAAKNLSGHKIPIEFVAVETLPRNEMGKLQHRRLQEQDAARQHAMEGATP